jgi:membrane protein YqaA with SNARE-associated domain
VEGFAVAVAVAVAVAAAVAGGAAGYYICVLILLYKCPHTHTTAYVPCRSEEE